MIDERIDRVRAAVNAGRITEREANAYLRATFGCSYADVRSRPAPAMPAVGAAASAAPPAPAVSPLASGRNRLREHAILTLLIVIPIIVILSLSYMDGSLTGFAVLDIPGESLTSDALPISETFTGINVSGTLYGDGAAAIYLDTTQGSLLVANITSDSGAPRTNKAGYAPGEEVLLEHAPEEATYYFDNGIASPTAIPFNATVNGTLLIVANESGALTTYRLPIIIGDARRQTTFESVCIETCSMNATNGTLRIETAGDAAIELEQVDIAAVAPNRAPQLAIQIPTQTVNDTLTLDLGLYFTDPDGEELSFAAGSSDLVDATIDGTILTMTPAQTGNGTLAIYASDLQELVPASIQLIVIAPQAAQESVVINETTNETANETTEQNQTPSETTQNTTLNESNATGIANGTSAANDTVNGTGTGATMDPGMIAYNSTNVTLLNCSSPNPNLRPVDCITLNASTLLEEDIYWESLDRARVGRFTQIGNLLIAGRAYKEDVAGQPESRDFGIGYTDDQFRRVTTVWVDQAGNLHLRGKLHELNANLNPPPGSHVMINRRGIYLAYADPTTGDLYLRGNLIPYRDDVQG